jgi:hypothetical protein
LFCLLSKGIIIPDFNIILHPFFIAANNSVPRTKVSPVLGYTVIVSSNVHGIVGYFTSLWNSNSTSKTE